MKNFRLCDMGGRGGEVERMLRVGLYGTFEDAV